MNEFLTFTKDSAFNLMKKAFFIGIIPLFFLAFWVGKYFAVLFPMDRQVPADIPGHFTVRSEPNIILGMLIGIGILIASALMWKIICQGILIALQAFETITNSNHHNGDS